MDHFESLIATLLEDDGYWVRRSHKVNVTKQDKQLIGKNSIPRPEIDLLAFNFSANEIIAMEAKSYLDSSGVKISDLKAHHEIPEGRYKLFTSPRYREIVFSQLLKDLIGKGMASSSTKITLGLAAGNVYQNQSVAIQKLMDKNGWHFWSPETIKGKVIDLAKRGYENDLAIITAKILTR
jgi:hypothetical protein